MSSFTIDTAVRNARVAEIERRIRAGERSEFVNVAAGETQLIEFKGGRFHVNGKRSTVTEAQEIIAENVESELYLEFEAEQRKLAAIAESEASQIAANEKLGDHAAKTEIKVAEVAALLSLSQVRVRRMCEEGKLTYGSRGTITVASLQSEIRRRAQAAKDAAQAKAERANAKKAQKLGEATDA